LALILALRTCDVESGDLVIKQSKLPDVTTTGHVKQPIQGVVFMGISKRLALVISGAAFTGAAALTVGAAAPAGAAVSAPASAPMTGQTLVNHIFGCGCWSDCWDDCDDWDW
jgi:hypothetical protein